MSNENTILTSNTSSEDKGPQKVVNHVEKESKTSVKTNMGASVLAGMSGAVTGTMGGYAANAFHHATEDSTDNHLTEPTHHEEVAPNHASTESLHPTNHVGTVELHTDHVELITPHPVSSNETEPDHIVSSEQTSELEPEPILSLEPTPEPTSEQASEFPSSPVLEPELTPIHFDGEVQVLGIQEIQAPTGEVADAALISDGTQQAVLIDVDRDGLIDVVLTDHNGNGQLDEGDIQDISAAHIEMSDLQAQYDAQNHETRIDDGLHNASYEQDYNNDADVTFV